MMANKPGSPGRTPPFILVGLLVLVCFLAYNYWSISSRNSELMAELDVSQKQAREASGGFKQMKESVDVIRTELSEAKKQIDAQKGVITGKDAEVEKFRKDSYDRKSETDTCQKSLATCSESLKTGDEEKKKLTDERDATKKELDDLKAAPKVCDKVSCEAPLKEAVAVVAKLTGLPPLVKALTDAGFDAAKLTEGIQAPAPVVEVKPAQ